MLRYYAKFSLLYELFIMLIVTITKSIFSTKLESSNIDYTTARAYSLTDRCTDKSFNTKLAIIIII